MLRIRFIMLKNREMKREWHVLAKKIDGITSAGERARNSIECNEWL